MEQCEELRKELTDSGDKLLVHCFGGDDFYASACNHNYIQDWAKSMQNNKVMIKVFFSYTQGPFPAFLKLRLLSLIVEIANVADPFGKMVASWEPIAM